MADTRSADRGGSTLARLLLILIVLALAAGPLVLHFAQKRHNILPFDLDARFPANQAFVSGEVFATTVADIVDHELRGGTGWRPNDFILWGPTLWADNNANRQLGIILAVRESVRVFKDHLTKVSSDQYDDNLVAADTAFRNDALKLWLPSAESKFSEGVSRLRQYVSGLHTTPPRSKPINQRNVELTRLMQAWSDLLGDAHAALYRDESFWRTDDVFYHAQGVAYVIGHLMRAIDREYAHSFEVKPVLRTLADEVAAALDQAATLKPLVVLDGSPDGLLANHRRNLDGYITEARQKVYSIREELER
ncbi:MAG TPA: DUF2333 family protein [Candidatus Binatia bacterium]|nr:DUF2333 family protein [Candidatus Binatia bacterium]